MTLQQDLATDLFWFLIILIALCWLSIWVGHAIRKDRLEAAYPQPDEDNHECSIGGCHQPATHAFPTGVTNVDYYACTGHTPTVRQWAGPYDRTIETVYDQEMHGTDLATWDQEMTS
jgi:hypothetical protein